MAKHIILVGFMGTGKSTVAAVLAERLGWMKVDLDTAIEQYEQATIPDIFADKGEQYFRQAETAALRRELEDSEVGKVLATGGGAVLAEENRKLMQRGGLVVALTASAEAIMERVKGDANRPLLQGNAEERVRTLLEQRKHAYDFAPIRIDTTGKSVSEIAELIIAKLG